MLKKERVDERLREKIDISFALTLDMHMNLSRQRWMIGNLKKKSLQKLPSAAWLSVVDHSTARQDCSATRQKEIKKIDGESQNSGPIFLTLIIINSDDQSNLVKTTRYVKEAKIWLNELNEGTFTSWNEMREAFISRYFSLAKFKHLLKHSKLHQLEFIITGEESSSSNTPNEALQISTTKSSQTDFLRNLKISLQNYDSEFLIIRKELKEMQDGHKDNHASQIYMKDDTPMCEPRDDVRMKLTSSNEANERMKNRQFEHLVKIQPSKSLPRTTNTKPRHEFVYKPPSIRNDDNKGDVKFIEVDETQPVPTMPNPNPIEANSPTISPFSKDYTVHIPYTNANTFADVVLLNHVGEKEFKSIVGNGI
ncbi:hypothetical protein Tco_0428358 [Tanacetum coccineum]